MSNCIDYNCLDALGDQTLNNCGEELLGGSSSVLLLECSSQLTDPSNATQIAAEIAAGRATLLKNVKVGYGKPSPVEIDSNISGGTTKLVTYDWAGTLVDGNVNANNVTFYNNVFSGRVFGGMVLYLVGTAEADSGAKVEWINSNVTFTGGKILPNTNKEFQTFEGDFKWRKKEGIPMLYSNPVGIFS